MLVFLLVLIRTWSAKMGILESIFESREQKIQRYSDNTRDRIQDIKSRRTAFEREEKKFTEELKRIPRNKVRDIRSKAKQIAAVQIRQKMADSALTQLEAMDQNFQNIDFQNAMVDSMVQTNSLIKEINEDTNMSSINKLIGNFQKNLDTMATDQDNLSNTLQGTLEGIDINTDEIVNQILTQNNIQLEIENRELSSVMQNGQTTLAPTIASPALVPIYTQAPPSFNKEQHDRFEALKTMEAPEKK